MWEDNFGKNMKKWQRKMDKMFSGIGEGIRKAWADFDEKDDEYILHVELPGIEKEDILLDVVGNRIEIKAEKKEIKHEVEDGGYCGYSKSYKGFARTLSLPEDAEGESIEADYKNGVLKIRIKKKEGAKKKRLNVEVK
jgi:HSP20 family protein